MQTIDFHTHLLGRGVDFSRPFDKIALALFAKKLGVDRQEILKHGYKAYEKAYIDNITNSRYIKRSVLLPVDGVVNDSGVETFRDKTVCSTNEDVYKVYMKYPETIVPFFSVNPNRHDALTLIDRYVAMGFVGAKFLQNFWDIDINDKKYLPYFQKIKSHNIPIIIHTGSEYAVRSNPLYTSVDVARQAIETGCKVVLAHFGVSIFMQKDIKKFFHNFSFDNSKFGDDYQKTVQYLEKYDNVYADISAIITMFRAKIVEDLAKNQKHIHHKLIFGTDYPVPFSVLFSYNSLSLSKRLELEKIQNPFDRYVRFVLEYFDKDSPLWTNGQKLIDTGKWCL